MAATYVDTTSVVDDLLGAVSELGVRVTDTGVDHPDGVAAAGARGRVGVVEGEEPLVDTVETPGHLGAVHSVLLYVFNSGEVADLGEGKGRMYSDNAEIYCEPGRKHERKGIENLNGKVISVYVPSVSF